MYGPPEQQTLEGVPIVSPITGTEKKCRVCGTELNDFNTTHYQILHRNYICRKCRREWQRKWVEDNPEKAKLINRKTHERNVEKKREYHIGYVRENRVKRNAQNMARYNKRMGRIDQKPCLVCGLLPSEMHHDDYSKPLEVKWLCPMHHRRVHRWVS